uniref:(California timema) hypothetical protein n=1 Tax=Timema californicum TaxID=61474 RepID=A0A7R9PFN6_TIMCA|nr:unnamed protein product [Timema californicum]
MSRVTRVSIPGSRERCHLVGVTRMSEESPSQQVKVAPRRRGRPPKKKLTPEDLVLSTEQSSPELAEGYRILQELMKGPHRMFLDPPNNCEKGMSDYHEVIYLPMWLDESELGYLPALVAR